MYLKRNPTKLLRFIFKSLAKDLGIFKTVIKTHFKKSLTFNTQIHKLGVDADEYSFIHRDLLILRNIIEDNKSNCLRFLPFYKKKI